MYGSEKVNQLLIGVKNTCDVGKSFHYFLSDRQTEDQNIRRPQI